MNRFAFIFALISSSAFGQVTVEPLRLDRVFIPQGFDDNDNIQVVVTGTLSDSCWNVGESRMVRSSDQIALEVDGVHQGCFCIPVEVPFHKVLELGKLRSGDYSIRTSSETYQLEVAHAPTPTQDSRLYANVLSGHVDASTLTLKGLHPDRSFYIKEIRVSKQEDGTIVVLPIAVQRPIIRDFVTVPFAHKVDLSRYVEAGKAHLIHIRSMNGTSVNLVETF